MRTSEATSILVNDIVEEDTLENSHIQIEDGPIQRSKIQLLDLSLTERVIPLLISRACQSVLRFIQFVIDDAFQKQQAKEEQAEAQLENKFTKDNAAPIPEKQPEKVEQEQPKLEKKPTQDGAVPVEEGAGGSRKPPDGKNDAEELETARHIEDIDSNIAGKYTFLSTARSNRSTSESVPFEEELTADDVDLYVSLNAIMLDNGSK
ncbi:unnamed protein product [Nippostrongylus brasiliensis]|uniref:PDEase domain-containing protein n=1 Tax=Nippostrongylus brasiliensis TaxID=27835 RepID=A0A158QWN7_NIPBR|nr:unnamed protein product [Nippostrongylus brasiliensis]